MRTNRMQVFILAFGLMVYAQSGHAQQEQQPYGERLEPREEAKQVAADDDDDSWIPGSFSGNVSLYSDYSFRGVSQTQRDMALQGGIDWEHESGIFLGVWGSSINLEDTNTYLEQDFYGGYAGSAGDLSYDVGAIFFFYPGDQVFNYWEFVANTAYDFGFMSTTVGLVGSPDYFGTLGTGFYIPVGFNFPIPWENDYVDLSIDLNGGYTKTEQLIFEDHHYFDWNLGLVVDLPMNLSLDFRYVDTDVKDVHDAGARFIFGATYSF